MLMMDMGDDLYLYSCV